MTVVFDKDLTLSQKIAEYDRDSLSDDGIWNYQRIKQENYDENQSQNIHVR